MKRSLNRLSILLLMLLGVLPQIALLIESLGLGADSRLWLWIAGAAVGLWVCACFRHGLLVGMPASAALLYAAYHSLHAQPLTELDDLADKASGAFYLHFYNPNGSYSYLNAVQDHSFLLLLLSFLLLAYLSSSLTSRGGRRFMSLIGTIPLPALCLSVNGIPSFAPVVGILLFWALILLAGNYDLDGSSGRILFSYSLPVLLLLSALLVLSHPEDYSFDERDLTLSRQFDLIGERLRHWIEQNELEGPLSLPEPVWTSPEKTETEVEAERLLWESSEGGMDLTQNYEPQTLEQVFLRVTAQRDGALYLRGVSYGDYTGTGWSSAEEAPLSSLPFAAKTVEQLGREQSVSLQSLLKLRYALLPYFSAVSGAEDAFVPAAKQSPREDYVHFTGDWDDVSSPDEAELLYRSFAHSVYTRLPENTKSVLLKLAASAGLDASSPNLAAEVASYIRDSGVYDLETEPYPDNDYAVYFLTVAHRGYCVHFATAAAAMYRALGIPARITEGFLVDAQRGKSVDVRGENAHAWVEIYRDGIGWLPVEVTGRGGLSSIPEETAQPERQSPQPERQREANEAEPDTEPSAKAAYPLPVGIVQPQDTEAGGSGTASRLLPGIVLLLLLSLLLPIRRLVLRYVWELRLRSKNPNKAAVALWRRAQALRRFGSYPPRQIESCAERACFSAHGATREELTACRALFDEQCQRLYPTLSRWKKFLFRYGYGLDK